MPIETFSPIDFDQAFGIREVVADFCNEFEVLYRKSTVPGKPSIIYDYYVLGELNEEGSPINIREISFSADLSKSAELIALRARLWAPKQEVLTIREKIYEAKLVNNKPI